MSASKAPNGVVIGKAGGSLDSYATWGKNVSKSTASTGQKGEVKTAAVLDKLALAPGGPTVLHDLRIPLAGITANIDHVLVAGSTVLIIDSKVWKPGFYWTLGGKSRRGTERVEHVDKKTMAMAYDALRGYFARLDISVDVVLPVVAVWPSSGRTPLRTRFLKVPGAEVINAEGLADSKAIRSTIGKTALRRDPVATADPAVVSALTQLLIR